MTAALINRSSIPYGARQFQEYIGKSTFRAFATTLSLFAALGLLLAALNIFKTTQDISTYIPNDPVTLVNYTTEIPLQVHGNGQNGAFTEPPALAGEIPDIANFVPVEKEIPADPMTFETPHSTPTGKTTGPALTALNPGGGSGENGVKSPGSDGTQSGTAAIPDKWDFNPVEKEPSVNLAQLAKNIIYPENAKRSGIEGKVLLRVLVGSDGNVLEADVVQSPNELLSKSAVSAVLKTRFTPAEQNGEFVNCWISIPVNFSLRQ